MAANAQEYFHSIVTQGGATVRINDAYEFDTVVGAEGQSFEIDATGIASFVDVPAKIKDYVDGLVDSNLKSPDSYDASSGNFPTDYKGTGAVAEGDTFYITVAGTIGSGTIVNVGDLLVAKIDAPGQTDANWFVLESNRDQATETTLGVLKIATQAIANAGTNDTDAITALKLATYLSDNGYLAVTYENGITESGGVVKLGGNLTGATAINKNGSSMSITGDGFVSIVDEDTADRVQLQVNKAGAEFSHTNVASGNKVGIALDIASGVIITDSENTFGMKYAADYSAAGSVDDRWIPDAGWVKSQLGQTRYTAAIASGDWTGSLGNYEITIPYATHGVAANAYLEVHVMRDIGGGSYRKAFIVAETDTSGNVTVKSTVNFDGLIIIN